MPDPAPVGFAASPDAVRDAAVEHLRAEPGDDGTLHVRPTAGRQPEIHVVLRLDGDGAGTRVEVRSSGRIDIPFFGWAFRPLVRVAQRRARRYAVDVLRAALEGAAEPAPPKPVIGLPEVGFSPEQATLLATASAATAVVTFAGGLFGQLAGPIGDAFGASDARLGLALALTRIGALFAFAVTAIADRRGRRRSILVGVVGSSVVCAVSAVAPNLAVFTGAQVLQRAFLLTTATVAGIAVIEEAPEGARAYTASMLALAGGFGFSFAVLALPLSDIGTQGWRIPFALGALTVFLAPRIIRNLSETTRYRVLATRADVARGRLRDVVERGYRRRFVLLAVVGFLTNVFSAPSSQLMNKYLRDERHYSGAGIALFRSVTTAVPGLIGLLIGGRLADARGRRPVVVIALVVATLTQIVFFVAGGPILWPMSAASVLASGAGGVALGTLDAELFPTEVRSTSNAMLIIVSVMGSAVGLAASGVLSDPVGGLGRAIALMGVGALVAAVFVVPRLPESVARTLDEISPTEPHGVGDLGEYRPEP